MGAPYFSKISLNIPIALSTPAQYHLGDANIMLNMVF